VKLAEYKFADISLLAEEVLREMPDQIVQYMMVNHIKANKQSW
jgi:hypothetical protein